ncbi:MAG: polysaccharide biosynthesis tyrosine autokinase [Stagnimonas sp.]|nr:polysaccharide biosynthesis tyrosine autokinase [Stagnimonas sp.]
MSGTALAVSQATRQAPSEIAALWRFFRRYRGGILLITLAAVLIGVLIALSLPPVYRSTVTLLIEPRSERVVQVAEVYDPTRGGSEEYYATQNELLRSRGLATRVVDKLDLANDDSFLKDTTNESLLTSLQRRLDWKQWLPGLPGQPEATAAGSPEQRRERAIQRVMGQVLVQPVPRTRLVRVHFHSSVPELAQRVAETIADAFIESGLESRLEATQRANRWLTDKLGGLSADLQKAEKALQEFRDSNQLVVVGGNRGMLDQEVMDNTSRLREAQRTKAALASTYARIRAAGNDPARMEQITALLADGAVQKVRSAVLDAQQVLKQVEERYGARHPQMASAITSLQAARRAFHEQLLIAAEGVRNQYEIAADTERQQSEVVAGATQRARMLDRKQFELGVLERNVQTNQQLYNMFLQRFKETDSTTNYEALNARVTDAALVPKSPLLPNRPKIVVMAALIGFLLGMILASLRHVLSEGLSSVEDLEAVAQVPLFGLVPKVAFKRGAGVIGQFRNDVKTPFAEGVRSVRTAVRLAEVAGRRQCYVITSAVPGEGKSSLAACLGMVLAGTEKTLLLEGDLRAPSLRKMLSVPKQQPGLMEVLLGSATLDAAIYTDEASKLDVLTVNQRPPNPAETVSSMAFAALLDQLRGRYERIIIDCPPVHAASDALMLARLSDAVLFVARADVTPAATVRRALHQLHNINAPLVGCVLNRVDVRRNPDAYGHYQYAYRYYG